MNNNGEKISLCKLSYVDRYILIIGNQVNKVFYKLNFTPNMLTTISIIISYIAVYNLYYGNYKQAAVLWFIGYMFDTFDGQFARKYNMVSVFGDYYDHFGDISKLILILYVILQSKIKNKFILLISCLLLFTMSVIVMGAQERWNETDTVLRAIKWDCDLSLYNYLKIFELGNVNFITSVMIYNLTD